MSTRLLEWALLAILATLLTCKVALGEEPPPCHGTKTTVVCTKDGFKVLTRTLIDLQGQVKELELKLGAAQADAVDAKKALDAAVAAIPPPPPPKPVWKPVTGFALGIIGGAAVIAAAALDTSASTRVALAAAGVGAAGVGFVLVLPND